MSSTPDPVYLFDYFEVYGVDGFHRSIIGRTSHYTSRELVERLLRQPSIGNCRRLPSGCNHHVTCENVSQQPNNLLFRNVAWVVSRHEKSKKIILEPTARFFYDRDEIGSHEKKLAHGSDIDHLRVNRDDHSGRGVQRAH